MIKKSRKRFLKLFFENICPAILKPPFVSIYLLYRRRELKGKKKCENFCETFFRLIGSLQLPASIHPLQCPGEQIDGVSGGPEDGAVQSLEDSGGLLAAGEELLHLSTPEHEQFYRRCRA